MECYTKSALLVSDVIVSLKLQCEVVGWCIQMISDKKTLECMYDIQCKYNSKKHDEILTCSEIMIQLDVYGMV